MPPAVSVIILNHNGIKDTIKCLKSLLKTNYKNIKVIVVDNGSEENETEKLKKIFKSKKIKYVRSPKNLGFCGGNNMMLKTVKTKYVALLNNDTEVTSNWLNPLVKLMEEDRKIAVTQPKILWLKNKKYFDYSGACGGFIDIFGYPFTRGRIFDTQEIDRGQYDNITDIFWASGAAMMIRTKVLNEVGFFDELFFNYMEEIDLCFRINRAGHRIVSNPKSVIYHKVASTASRNSLRKRYWEHRNNLLLILKNYPAKKLIFIFPARIILEYISVFYYLYMKRIDYAAAVIKGQIALMYLLPKMIHAKRKLIYDKKVKNLTFHKSILLSYFIFKKRKYYQAI